LPDAAYSERCAVQLKDIVDDDVAPSCLQRSDIGRETRDAVLGRGEIQAGSGRHVINDFHHGRAFVAGACLSSQHREARRRSAVCRKIDGSLARRAAGRAVRQHSDLQTGAIHAIHAACIHSLVREIALGFDGALPDDRDSLLVQDGSQLLANWCRSSFEVRSRVREPQRPNELHRSVCLGQRALFGEMKITSGAARKGLDLRRRNDCANTAQTRRWCTTPRRRSLQPAGATRPSHWRPCRRRCDCSHPDPPRC